MTDNTYSGLAASAPAEASGAEPSGLIRRYTISLWVATVALLVFLIGDVLPLSAIHVLQQAVARYGAGQVPMEEMPDVEAFQGFGALFTLLGFPLILSAFFVAMARARRIAMAVGVAGFDCSLGWTIASFFIPILNFYRPWIGLAEIRNAVILSSRFRQGGEEWKNHEGPTGATWALGAVAVVMPIVSRHFDPSSVPDPQSAGDLPQWIDAQWNLTVIGAAIELAWAIPFVLYLMALYGPLKQLIALYRSGQLKIAGR
jgi:hypothetical protein